MTDRLEELDKMIDASNLRLRQWGEKQDEEALHKAERLRQDYLRRTGRKELKP